MAKLLLGLSAEIVAHLDDLRVVELSLLAVCAKARVMNFLEFLGKVFEDFLLGPSENERCDHPAESLHPLLVRIADDRRLELSQEGSVIVQEGGHCIVEDTPQLAEPVLDRCSGQREPRLRLYELHTLGSFRPLVLDILRLINDLIVEAAVLILGNVAL